jgi:parvulin-like peptidyl-prolyl isomerase
MARMKAAIRTLAPLLVAGLACAPAACSARRGLEPTRPGPGTAVDSAAEADASSRDREEGLGAASVRASLASDAPDASGASRDPVAKGSGRTPALWRNDAIPGDELDVRALEAAGALALEEMLIERALRIELARRELSVTEEAIAAEEAMAREALSPDPARAEQLLQALRASQGLGAVRWPALLWRNAALRTLARSQSTAGDVEIATAHDLRHGARRAARIIVLPDLASVQSAMDRLAVGDAFADVAATMSTDASRDRGGLVSPVARLDPSWPATVREALWTIDVGTNSAPVLIDDGYVIVRCEGETPGDGVTLEDARAESERTARLAVDRVEMDRILREIVRDLDPTIFDRTLEESWQRTRNARRVP